LCLESETILDKDTHDPERILTMIEARQGLDIGMGYDSWGRFNSSRMTFFFVVRDDEKFKLDEFKRRICDLAQDGVSVLFEWVTIS